MKKQKINFLKIILLLNLMPFVLSNFLTRWRDKNNEFTSEIREPIKRWDLDIPSENDNTTTNDVGVENLPGQEENMIKEMENVIQNLKNQIEHLDDKKIPEYDLITPLNLPPPRPAIRTQPLRQCLPSITIFRGRTVCKDDLIFEENFDTLNTDIWKRVMRFPLETEDAEFVTYQNYPESCFVSEGKLHVNPKLLIDFPGFDELRLRSGQLDLGAYCTGNSQHDCLRNAGLQFILPPVVSCKLNTNNTFSFKYGKVEIRAKFPKGDWIFPQLYLEPVENAYGSTSYASGQIRVGFIRSNEMLETKENTQIDGYQLSGGLVMSPLPTLRDLWMKSTLSDSHYGNDFHTYTLSWTNNRISVAVDGITYANYRAGSFRRQAQANGIPYATAWNDGGPMAPFDKEFYLSLGVGVGGMADFPDLSVNGILGAVKPWNNTSPKAEFNFWANKDNWYPTWAGLEAAMKVDYVKVWAV